MYLLAGSTGFLGNDILKELGNIESQTIALSRRAIPSLPDNAQELIIDFDNLSEAERLQFISMVQGLMRVWEEAFYQYSENRLDHRVWSAWCAQYRDWISSYGFQRVWALRKHTYSHDFQQFVDGIELGEYNLA